MTNISKNALDSKTQEKLFRQFCDVFSNCNAAKVSLLLEDILTPTEKIMLVKRVAVIFMLLEDFSNYKIAKTLHVSESTVRETRRRYREKEFAALIKEINESNFDKEKFWKTLDVLLRLGMPPMGRGRWQYLYDEGRKNKNLYRG